MAFQSSNIYSSIPGQYNPISQTVNAPVQSYPWQTPQISSIPGQYNQISGTYNANNNNGAVINSGGVSSSTSDAPPSRNDLGKGVSIPTGGNPETEYVDIPGRGRTKVGDLIREGYFNQPAGPDYGQINSVFDEVNNLLNQRQQTTEAGKQDYINQYTGQFDAQKPLLEASYNQGLALNQQQGQQASYDAEKAKAGQRQLFSELQQGNQQRFGGASSAGEVASALQGRQFQQNMGNVENTLGQNQQDLARQATQIQTNYQANLQSLEAQKQSAISQAQVAFQQRLDEISNMKLQNEQNKAQAKLGALQELRAQAQQIQTMYAQQQMQLDSDAKNAVAQIVSQVASYKQSAGQSVNLQQIAQQTIPGINQIYGTGGGLNQGGYSTGKKYDLYGNPIN